MHFKVQTESDSLTYTDEERRQLADKNTSKADRIRILYDIYQRRTQKDRLTYEGLKQEYALYFEAFATIGYAKVKELGFKDRDIRAEIDCFQFARQIIRPEVIKAVYQYFQPNTTYSTEEVNRHLQAIYDARQIKYDKRGVGKNITHYFDALEVRTGKQRQWKLNGKKY